MKMRVSGCHRNEGKPVNMWRHNLRSHLAAAATLGVALRQRKGPGIWSIARPVLRRRRRHHDYPRIHAAGQRLLQWLRRRCNGERVRKTVRALECERFVCVRHFWLDNPSRFVTMLRLKMIGHLIRFRTQSAAPQKKDSPFAAAMCFVSVNCCSLAPPCFTFRFILSYEWELLLMTSHTHTHTLTHTHVQHTFGLYPYDESRRCLIVSRTTAECGSRVEK